MQAGRPVSIVNFLAIPGSAVLHGDVEIEPNWSGWDARCLFGLCHTYFISGIRCCFRLPGFGAKRRKERNTRSSSEETYSSSSQLQGNLN
eukprot:scaffold3498_cov176-Amphora_coffeaeformis.AAC.7